MVCKDLSLYVFKHFKILLAELLPQTFYNP